MRGKLMWVGWVSGSTLLQGTSVVMSAFIFNGTSGRGYGQHKWSHPNQGGLEPTGFWQRSRTSQNHSPECVGGLLLQRKAALGGVAEFPSIARPKC
eukprot:1156567-Pelagomonas_calceolata.AAC.3